MNFERKENLNNRPKQKLISHLFLVTISFFFFQFEERNQNETHTITKKTEHTSESKIKPHSINKAQ